MSLTADELDLMPLEELMSAIARRFDGLAFVAFRGLTSTQRSVLRVFHGDILKLVGALQFLQTEMLARHEASECRPEE